MSLPRGKELKVMRRPLTLSKTNSGNHAREEDFSYDPRVELEETERVARIFEPILLKSSFIIWKGSWIQLTICTLVANTDRYIELNIIFVTCKF